MPYNREGLYPSTEELIAPAEGMICEELQTLVAERHRDHECEYTTTKRRMDGRFINACMDADSVEDAVEEVADAIFNILVCVLKGSIEPRVADRMLVNLDLCFADLAPLRRKRA